MKFFVLLLPLCVTGLEAHAQTATRLGELRMLLQQKTPVFKAAPAADPSPVPAPIVLPIASPTPPPRQLSAEERAELRRQLTEFRRPAGKGS